MEGVTKEWVVVGAIGKPFGIKGQVHIHSFTEPKQNILNFDVWYISSGEKKNTWQPIKIKPSSHKEGLVVRMEGCEDRNQASLMTGKSIAVERSALPLLPTGSYYWADLNGLKVCNKDGSELGVVDYLYQTAANDVMIVKGQDKQFHIPFIIHDYVLNVNLSTKEIIVDWDPEYS